MLKTRVLVAVIALPILIAVIVIGGWLFAILVLGALLLGGDEYVRLLRQGTYRPPGKIPVSGQAAKKPAKGATEQKRAAGYFHHRIYQRR